MWFDIEKIQHLILHFSGVKLGINRIKDWYSEIISARMVLEYWYATRPFQNGSYQTWSPVSTEPKEPETTLMSLQSFQKAYQKISQLNQFLIIVWHTGCLPVQPLKSSLVMLQYLSFYNHRQNLYYQICFILIQPTGYTITKEISNIWFSHYNHFFSVGKMRGKSENKKSPNLP